MLGHCLLAAMYRSSAARWSQLCHAPPNTNVLVELHGEDGSIGRAQVDLVLAIPGIGLGPDDRGARYGDNCRSLDEVEELVCLMR